MLCWVFADKKQPQNPFRKTFLIFFKKNKITCNLFAGLIELLMKGSENPFAVIREESAESLEK